MVSCPSRARQPSRPLTSTTGRVPVGQVAVQRGLTIAPLTVMGAMQKACTTWVMVLKALIMSSSLGAHMTHSLGAHMTQCVCCCEFRLPGHWSGKTCWSLLRPTHSAQGHALLQARGSWSRLEGSRRWQPWCHPPPPLARPRQVVPTAHAARSRVHALPPALLWVQIAFRVCVCACACTEFAMERTWQPTGLCEHGLCVVATWVVSTWVVSTWSQPRTMAPE